VSTAGCRGDASCRTRDSFANLGIVLFLIRAVAVVTVDFADWRSEFAVAVFWTLILAAA
jgi:hypothetical protein